MASNHDMQGFLTGDPQSGPSRSLVSLPLGLQQSQGDEMEPADLLQSTGEVSRLRRRGALRADHFTDFVSASGSGPGAAYPAVGRWVPYSRDDQSGWPRSVTDLPWNATAGDHLQDDANGTPTEVLSGSRISGPRQSPPTREPVSRTFLDSSRPDYDGRRYDYKLYCGRVTDSIGLGSGSDEEIWEDSDPERWNRPWKPSPLPTPPPTSLPKRKLKRPTRNGCGSVIHSETSPTVRRDEWTGGHIGASELLIPIAEKYCDEDVLIKLHKSRCRRRQGERTCQCRCEAVACASCGNVLGVRVTPCSFGQGSSLERDVIPWKYELSPSKVTSSPTFEFSGPSRLQHPLQAPPGTYTRAPQIREAFLPRPTRRFPGSRNPISGESWDDSWLSRSNAETTRVTPRLRQSIRETDGPQNSSDTAAQDVDVEMATLMSPSLSSSSDGSDYGIPPALDWNRSRTSLRPSSTGQMTSEMLAVAQDSRDGAERTVDRIRRLQRLLNHISMAIANEASGLERVGALQSSLNDTALRSEQLVQYLSDITQQARSIILDPVEPASRSRIGDRSGTQELSDVVVTSEPSIQVEVPMVVESPVVNPERWIDPAAEGSAVDHWHNPLFTNSPLPMSPNLDHVELDNQHP